MKFEDPSSAASAVETNNFQSEYSRGPEAFPRKGSSNSAGKPREFRPLNVYGRNGGSCGSCGGRAPGPRQLFVCLQCNLEEKFFDIQEIIKSKRVSRRFSRGGVSSAYFFFLMVPCRVPVAWDKRSALFRDRSNRKCPPAPKSLPKYMELRTRSSLFHFLPGSCETTPE